MTEILSAEEVQRCNSWTAERSEMWRRLDALFRSHEALRADRDRLASLVDVTRKHRQWAERSKDAAEARLAEVEQALRTALRVIDTTHALAFGRDALAPPCDGRSLAEHGGVGVYCWACEFTLEARAVLDKGEPAPTPSRRVDVVVNKDDGSQIIYEVRRSVLDKGGKS